MKETIGVFVVGVIYFISRVLGVYIFGGSTNLANILYEASVVMVLAGVVVLAFQGALFFIRIARDRWFGKKDYPKARVVRDERKSR